MDVVAHDQGVLRRGVPDRVDGAGQRDIQPSAWICDDPPGDVEPGVFNDLRGGRLAANPEGCEAEDEREQCANQ